MEENNINSNQSVQKNTQNVVTQQNNGNNNKNIIIIILVLIIVGLLGYFAYDKFIQKGNSGGSEENNSQEKGNSNQQSNDNNGKEQNTNNVGISKKLISLKGSCNDISESYNGIKVELKKSPDSERCIYDLKINDKRIFNDDQLESIEIYDNYVIVFSTSDGGSAIYLVDTTNKNYKVYDGIEYHDTDTLLGCSVAYNPDSYISDENGILITGSDFSGPCGTTSPGHKFAKIRVSYQNGKFGSPEIVEKYD